MLKTYALANRDLYLLGLNTGNELRTLVVVKLETS